MMTFEAKSVRLANGLSMPYLEQGDPDGTPILMIHGYSDSSFSFEPVLEYLPSNVRGLAVTLRGHGDADRPPSGYGMGDFANDVALFAEALELRPAVVVGHSMGSGVARYFAVEHPERTSALVLIGAFAKMRGNPVIEELAQAIRQLSDPVDPVFVREFQESTIAQPVPPGFVDRAVAESLKLPARVWRAVLDGMLSSDFEDRLVTVPVLAVWGDRDAIFGQDDWDALAATLPNVRIELYPGAGHATHWEHPDRFAYDLVAFTESVVTDAHLGASLGERATA